MKRLLVLFTSFLLFANFAFADNEQFESLIGEWYWGSFFNNSRWQVSVEVKENSIECDGYCFYAERDNSNALKIYVTCDEYKTPVEANYIELSDNHSVLLHWLYDEELCAYYIAESASGDLVFGYEVSFSGDKILFLDDEIYIKSEKTINNHKEYEIEKMRYLHREDELFLIEDNNYARCEIFEISDMYVVMSNQEVITYRNGKPIYMLYVLLRTSSVK